MAQTIRYSQLLKVFTLLLALAWTAQSAQAQSKNGGKAPQNQPPAQVVSEIIGHQDHGVSGGLESQIKLRIEKVARDSAQARNNPDGPGRLVPFAIAWAIESPASLRVEKALVRIATLNTTGAKTEKAVELKAAEFAKRKVAIDLPMKEGEFAKSYETTITVYCAESNGKQISKTASVRGDLPEEKALGKAIHRR